MVEEEREQLILPFVKRFKIINFLNHPLLSTFYMLPKAIQLFNGRAKVRKTDNLAPDYCIIKMKQVRQKVGRTMKWRTDLRRHPRIHRGKEKCDENGERENDTESTKQSSDL